jgi:hypothetical protein
MEEWKVIKESDNDEALRMMCPVGYRIIDNSTGKTIFQP